jgi:hypothetical protein
MGVSGLVVTQLLLIIRAAAYYKILSKIIFIVREESGETFAG